MNIVGNLVTFGYLTEEESYFDMVPLVLVLKVNNKSVFGVNIHYWPINDRLSLLAKLENNGYEAINIIKALTEIRVTRRLISSNLKMYLFSNIQTKIKKFNENEFKKCLEGKIIYDQETMKLMVKKNQVYLEERGI